MAQRHMHKTSYNRMHWKTEQLGLVRKKSFKLPRVVLSDQRTFFQLTSKSPTHLLANSSWDLIWVCFFSFCHSHIKLWLVNNPANSCCISAISATEAFNSSWITGPYRYQRIYITILGTCNKRKCEKKRHRMASFTERKVLSDVSTACSSLPTHSTIPSLCLKFQKEAFAVLHFWVQQAPPAETLIRTISDPFCQINICYFLRCVGCYWQRFSFHFLSSWVSSSRCWMFFSQLTECLWLLCCWHKNKDKQGEGQFA